MAVLGITGGVGAGKSRILRILKEVYGARVIQADQIAKELEEPGCPGLTALEKVFGADILDGNGCLDRPAFAQLIFGDPQARETVNQILHPLVWQEIKRRTSEGREELVAVEAALFDERSKQLCEYLIFVDADEKRRSQRLMEHRGYTRTRCIEMINSQPSRTDFLAIADFVIDNNGTVEHVQQQLSRILEEVSRREHLKKKKKGTYQ